MTFDRHISDAAQAAGFRLLIANDVHLAFLDRRGRKHGFYRSAVGWVEAELTPNGWRVAVRQGSGLLLNRAVRGFARGATLDDAAAGAGDVFPSAVAVLRATAPVAVAVRKPSRLASWLGLSSARAA